MARERTEEAEIKAEQQRRHLDYIRRILHGAMLFLDVNRVPGARLRNNLQNAVHAIGEQLKEDETA